MDSQCLRSNNDNGTLAMSLNNRKKNGLTHLVKETVLNKFIIIIYFLFTADYFVCWKLLDFYCVYISNYYLKFNDKITPKLIYVRFIMLQTSIGCIKLIFLKQSQVKFNLHCSLSQWVFNDNVCLYLKLCSKTYKLQHWLWNCVLDNVTNEKISKIYGRDSDSIN